MKWGLEAGPRQIEITIALKLENTPPNERNAILDVLLKKPEDVEPSHVIVPHADDPPTDCGDDARAAKKRGAAYPEQRRHSVYGLQVDGMIVYHSLNQ